MSIDLTIKNTVQSLSKSLKGYLEAQYHIKDESLLADRGNLLDKEGTIAQSPFLEATPAYALAKPFSDLPLPSYIREFFTAMVAMKVGIYPQPYIHQATALEAFLAGKDIMAATGTGSGKTEIFLFSILSMLAEEGEKRKAVAQTTGMRTLVLYPMNALVADQVARMRKIFGDKKIKAELERRRGRHATFGMYTGRTPFPGLISEKKIEANALWNEYFSKIMNDPVLFDALKERGKWPSKDIAKFFGEKGTDWSKRLITDPDDAELLMRHEMQQKCPDILVTNYSMLEYMLLRPIEKPIFDQTATYLKGAGTYLTVVLDEAHMYRGATGAEVAFLLRRLRARLGIKREQMRFILTTASVGDSQKDEDSAVKFSRDLTGAPENSTISFIRGTKEKHSTPPRSATLKESDALACFDVSKFHEVKSVPKNAAAYLNSILQALQLPQCSLEPKSPEDVQNEIYLACQAFGPAVHLIEAISGKATKLTDAANLVFPRQSDPGKQLQALDALITIGNYAKEKKTGKVFLPARLHLFFKGLSGIFACVNPACSSRDSLSPINPLLGKLHAEPQERCACNSRVYELLTHRDCGGAFLKVYTDKTQAKPDFLWHEPTNYVGANGKGLQEMHVHISRDEPAFKNRCNEAWIQIASGKVVWECPSNLVGWRIVYFPADPLKPQIEPTFSDCPACTKSTTNTGTTGPNNSRIMDLRTKGEQPFSQLVQRQMLCQPLNTAQNKEKFPNQGRKVLLFSDGRQKAARLAKNIPEEVESDGLRQLLVIAHQKIQACKDPRTVPLPRVYQAFIAACLDSHIYLFNKRDAAILRKDIADFNKLFPNDFPTYFSDEDAPNAPDMYKEKLYKQVSGGLYSLRFMVVGWLEPRLVKFNRLAQQFKSIPETDLKALCIEWIQVMARAGDIDDSLKSHQRGRIVGYNKGAWGNKGKLPKLLSGLFDKIKGSEDKAKFESEFLSAFCTAPTNSSSYFLNPKDLSLVIDFDQKWICCKRCGEIAPYPIANMCPSCASSDLATIDPNTDPYVESRKGYWRSALKAVHKGELSPLIIHAEEHTAQLSHRDNATGKTLTEEYELRFQDITSDPELPPVDVLSCTTTMEVGIDIGSLVAVGLRNVPPQRENYQQRAGRAGRRGSSISTVVTYCQGGAHDSYYYQNVAEIVSGTPRCLNVKVNNAKIARRHLHAFLLQEFFNGKKLPNTSDISSSLGGLDDFFFKEGDLSLKSFGSWTTSKLSSGLGKEIANWIGTDLEDVKDIEVWAKDTSTDFLDTLKELESDAKEVIAREVDLTAKDKIRPTNLLDFLFDHSILPTYAFPTSLASFKVEESNARTGLSDKYLPQQSISRALTEYAPGRLITIDKDNYKCTAVTANVMPTVEKRAEPLFTDPHRKPYIFCSSEKCSYVEDVGHEDGKQREGVECPLCKSKNLKVMELITPEVFLPFCGQTFDEQNEDQEFSYATPAQFPVPVHNVAANPLSKVIKTISDNLEVVRAPDAELVVVNKGDTTDMTGFYVCDCCGDSKLAHLGGCTSPHDLPYMFTPKQGGRPEYRPKCNGTYKNVFLGTRFRTDLLILRFKIEEPLCDSPQSGSEDFAALSDGLLTLANSLPIAVGTKFDVDSTEFSSGYRLVQEGTSGFFAEVYMFDNLAGGAGYSERAAEMIEDILKIEVANSLKCTCATSCYRCLRHYNNQFDHHKLDRVIASDLLNFALNPLSPLPEPSVEQQKVLMKGLSAMAEYNGDRVTWDEEHEGIIVPLTVSRNGKQVHLFVINSLTSSRNWEAPLDSPGLEVHAFNAYKLSRNLPVCFLDLDEWLR